MDKEKREIKAIIFDIGGILTNSRKDLVRKELTSKHNINENELLEEIIKYHRDLIIGNLSQIDFLKNLEKRFNIDIKTFSLDWEYLLSKHFIINKEIKKIIKKLSKIYLIGSLSNVTPLFEKIRKKKGVYENITLNLSSFKEGVAKPDEKFYQILLERIKFHPEEIIFIDDREKNLFPAKKLGIKTILFENNQQLIRDLKNFGVKI